MTPPYFNINCDIISLIYKYIIDHKIINGSQSKNYITTILNVIFFKIKNSISWRYVNYLSFMLTIILCIIIIAYFQNIMFFIIYINIY